MNDLASNPVNSAIPIMVSDLPPNELQEAADLQSPNVPNSTVEPTRIQVQLPEDYDGAPKISPPSPKPQETNIPAEKTAEAISEIRPEEQQEANSDTDDNVSVASEKLRSDWNQQPLRWNSDTHHGIERDRKDGVKYARVTSLYVEGLETRVAMLEEDIYELQILAGSKRREEDHPM